MAFNSHYEAMFLPFSFFFLLQILNLWRPKVIEVGSVKRASKFHYLIRAKRDRLLRDILFKAMNKENRILNKILIVGLS